MTDEELILTARTVRALTTYPDDKTTEEEWECYAERGGPVPDRGQPHREVIRSQEWPAHFEGRQLVVTPLETCAVYGFEVLGNGDVLFCFDQSPPLFALFGTEVRFEIT